VPAERLTALDPAPEDLFMVVEDIMTLCWFRDLVVWVYVRSEGYVCPSLVENQMTVYVLLLDS
jgi:hypothetical protein